MSQEIVLTRLLAPFTRSFTRFSDRDGYPIERVWADAHPEAFTLVYGPTDGERFARIYRVHPPGVPPIGPSAGAARPSGSGGRHWTGR